MQRPKIAFTMGDIAGVGPEVVARVCADAEVLAWCQPIVVGHPEFLTRAFQLIGKSDRCVSEVQSLGQVDPNSDSIHCLNPSGDEVLIVAPGELDARSGQAAYDCLVSAIQASLVGDIDAICTAPLNKKALRLAGLNYPGHTEILAEECGVNDFAMMLYLPPGEKIQSPFGLGVAHVTLHTSIASVPGLLSTEAISEKIGLISGFLSKIGCAAPRVAVCALNPHAGELGLFGDEEATLIEPAVLQSKASGIDVTGPLPADTLFHRAVCGEFDGVVAMYHDQGHIALKLLGFETAVNVTLGLPIVRTSPSHGTAFDIAWQGSADATGMKQAVRVAALLAQGERTANLSN